MENITNIEALGFIRSLCTQAELLKEAGIISNYNYSLNYDTVGYEIPYLNIEFTLVIRGAEDIKFETKWYDKEEAEVVRARLHEFRTKVEDMIDSAFEFFKNQLTEAKEKANFYEVVIDTYFKDRI